MRAERLPIIGRFIKKNSSRFPANVRPGNIVRGLPVPDGSATGVYASHVLEHLTRDEFDVAIKNTYRILKPGGIFRLIVPDLEGRCRRYIALLEQSDANANDWLMVACHLGMAKRPDSLLGSASLLLGRSIHLWMWDFLSMRQALEDAGFTSVRRCQLGDSSDPMFNDVEDEGRFFDHDRDIAELAVEAIKP